MEGPLVNTPFVLFAFLDGPLIPEEVHFLFDDVHSFLLVREIFLVHLIKQISFIGIHGTRIIAQLLFLVQRVHLGDVEGLEDNSLLEQSRIEGCHFQFPYFLLGEHVEN